MSQLERFYQALMHKEPDIVPIMLFPIRTEEIDVKYVTVLNINDQESLARGLEFTLSFFRNYPDVMPFGGLAPSYPDMTFGSLFGSRPMSSPDGAYMPSPAFKDLKEAVRTLEIPTDFHKAKGLMNALDNIRYYVENVPDDFKERYGVVENWGSFAGPEGIVTGGIIDYETYLVGLKFKPDLVHELTEIVTAYNIEWLKAVEEIVGRITKLVFSDHSPTFLSPSQFDEFFIPYVSQITGKFSKSLIIYHNEGEISHHLSKLPGLGIDAFHIGPETDIGEAKKVVGDRITLIGNIDPVDVFLRGTADQVENACIQVLRKAAAGGGLVLSTGGGPPRMPVAEENIMAMISAVEKFGKDSKMANHYNV